MNDPIFKSSNARGLPGLKGGGMLKFQFDRRINYVELSREKSRCKPAPANIAQFRTKVIYISNHFSLFYLKRIEMRMILFQKTELFSLGLSNCVRAGLHHDLFVCFFLHVYFLILSKRTFIGHGYTPVLYSFSSRLQNSS